MKLRMSKADNIAAVSTIMPMIQMRDWHRLDEVLAPNIVDHDPAEGQPPGLDGIKWFWRKYTTAFPDLTFDLVVLSADEDYVTLVIRHFGTHTGEWQGHAATGRRFSIRGIQFVKFANGRIVERWGSSDMLGLLQQLGLA
jgi:predicted ester cyclase